MQHSSRNGERGERGHKSDCGGHPFLLAFSSPRRKACLARSEDARGDGAGFPPSVAHTIEKESVPTATRPNRDKESVRQSVLARSENARGRQGAFPGVRAEHRDPTHREFEGRVLGWAFARAPICFRRRCGRGRRARAGLQ